MHGQKRRETASNAPHDSTAPGSGAEVDRSPKAVRMHRPPERQCVLPLPSRAPRRAALAGAMVTDAQAAALAACRGKTTKLAVFVDRVAKPVDTRVLADHLVVRVNHDALVVLVEGILGHPIRVEHTETATGAANAFLSLGAQVTAPLVLIDATVARLAEVDALRQLLLATATADAHTVDDKALLCLVAKIAGLVGPGRPGSAMDHRELAVLPAADAQKEADRVSLLLAPELLQVLEGTLRSKAVSGDQVRASSESSQCQPVQTTAAQTMRRCMASNLAGEREPSARAWVSQGGRDDVSCWPAEQTREA
eukprot:scaffold107071_cov37-Tisochrysis_lutea.AAC.1